VRVLHVSDLHFGVHSVAEQVEAIEQMIEHESFDVVAVSGDLTQRARAREFARARAFLSHAQQHDAATSDRARGRRTSQAAFRIAALARGAAHEGQLQG
jgi:3',5'-cyclic AMP phosphodiesterase CpdA